jgi:hypothetical protein
MTDMFEDFRKQLDDNAFPEDSEPETPPSSSGHPHRGYFLGLSPAQRFIVAFMLLMMVVILGTLFLMVTNKIALPSSL